MYSISVPFRNITNKSYVRPNNLISLKFHFYSNHLNAIRQNIILATIHSILSVIYVVYIVKQYLRGRRTHGF